jgi:hypothetical protein
MRLAPQAFAALVALALPFGACTSSAPPPPPRDAGLGPLQPLGGVCDESIPHPCVILGDPCSASVCDMATHLCTRVAVDGGPTCSTAPPACAADCDAGPDAGADAQADAEVDAAAVDGAPSEAGPPDAGDAGDGSGETDGSLDAPAEAGDAPAE